MGIDYLESRNDHSRYYDHRDHRTQRQQASPDESRLNQLTSTLSMLARKRDYYRLRDPGSLRLEIERHARHASPPPRPSRHHRHSEERYIHHQPHHREDHHHRHHHQNRPSSNSPPRVKEEQGGMYRSRPGPPGPYERSDPRSDPHLRPLDPYSRESRSRAEAYSRPESYRRPEPDLYPRSESRPRVEAYPRPDPYRRPEPHHTRPESYPLRPEHHSRPEPFHIRTEHHPRADPYLSHSRSELPPHMELHHSRPELSRTSHHTVLSDRESVLSDSRRSSALPGDHRRRSISPHSFITLDSLDADGGRQRNTIQKSDSVSSSPVKANPKTALKLIRKFMCSSDEEDSPVTRTELEPSESGRPREHQRSGLIIRRVFDDDDSNRDVTEVNSRPSSVTSHHHRSSYRHHRDTSSPASSSHGSSRHRSARHHRSPPPAPLPEAPERKRRDSESSYVTISSDNGSDDHADDVPSKHAKKAKNDRDKSTPCKKKRKSKKKKPKQREVENEAENLDLLKILSEDYSAKETTSACMSTLDHRVKDETAAILDQEPAAPSSSSTAKSNNSSTITVKSRKEKKDEVIVVTNGTATNTAIPCKKKKTAAAPTTANHNNDKKDLRNKLSSSTSIDLRNSRTNKSAATSKPVVITEKISSIDITGDGSSNSPKDDSDINRLRLEAIESINRRSRTNVTEPRDVVASTATNVPLPAPSINFDFTADDATEISFTQDFEFDQNPHKLHSTRFGVSSGDGNNSADSDCEIIETTPSSTAVNGNTSSVGVYDFRSISNLVAKVRADTTGRPASSGISGIDEHHTTPILKSKTAAGIRDAIDQEMYEKALKGKELLEQGVYNKTIKAPMPKWNSEFPKPGKTRVSTGLACILKQIAGDKSASSSEEEGEIKSREGERPNVEEVEMEVQMATEDTTKTINSGKTPQQKNTVAVTEASNSVGVSHTEMQLQAEAGRQVTDMEIDDDDSSSNTDSIIIVLPAASKQSVTKDLKHKSAEMKTSDTNLPIAENEASNADNTVVGTATKSTDVFDSFPYNDLLEQVASPSLTSPDQPQSAKLLSVELEGQKKVPSSTKTPPIEKTVPVETAAAVPGKRHLPDDGEEVESGSLPSSAKQAKLEPSLTASSSTTSSSEKDEVDSDQQQQKVATAPTSMASSSTASTSRSTHSNGKSTEENHARLLELLKRDEYMIEKYLKRKTTFSENTKKLQQNAERLEAKLAACKTELKNCEREAKENEQQLQKIYDRRLKRYKLENKYALELKKPPLRRMKTITVTTDASKKQVKPTTTTTTTTAAKMTTTATAAPPPQREDAKSSKSASSVVSQSIENNTANAQNLESDKQHGEDARHVMADIKQMIENMNPDTAGSYPVSKSQVQNNLEPEQPMVVATTPVEQLPLKNNTDSAETATTTATNPTPNQQQPPSTATMAPKTRSTATKPSTTTSQTQQRTTRSNASAANLAAALPTKTANKPQQKNKQPNKVAATTPMEVDATVPASSSSNTSTATKKKTATGKSRDEIEAEKTRLLETEKALKKDINKLVKYQKINKPNTRKAAASASTSAPSTTTRQTKHSKINNSKVVKKYNKTTAKTSISDNVPLTKNLQQAVLTSKKVMAAMKPAPAHPHLLPLDLPPKIIKPPPSLQHQTAPVPPVRKPQQQASAVVAQTADNPAENQQKTTKKSLSTLTEKQMLCLVNYVTKKTVKKLWPEKSNLDMDSVYGEAPKWMVEYNYDLSELAPKPRNVSDKTDTCSSESDLTYQSPLLAFHSYRLTSKFEQNEIGLKLDDPCMSNLVDPHTIICSYDLTGVCCNPDCRFQHLSVRSAMSAEQLYLDLLAYCPTMMKTSAGKTVTADDPMEVKLEAAEATVKRLCGDNKTFTVSKTARALALRINRALDTNATLLTARQREFLPCPLGGDIENEDDEETCGGEFFQLSTLPPQTADSSESNPATNPEFELRPMGRYFTDCDVTFDEEVTLEKMMARLKDEPLNTDLRLSVANRFLAAGKYNMALHVLCIGIENEEYCEEMWLAYVKPLRRYKLINDDGSFNINQTNIVRQGLEIFPLSRVLWEEVLCWEWPVDDLKSLYLEIIDNLSNRENIHREEPVKGYLADDSYYSRWLLSMVIEYIHFIKETNGIASAKQECEAQLKNFHENRAIVKAGGNEPLAMTSRDMGLLHVAYIHLREFDSLPSGFYDDSVSTLRFGLCVGEKKIELPFSPERKLHLTIEELNKMILNGVMICEDENVGIERNLEDLYPLYQALIDLKASERDWSGITVVFEDTMVRLSYENSKLSLACKEFCVLCMEKILGSGLEVYITRISEKALKYFPRSPRVSLMIARYLWRAPRKEGETRSSAEITTLCLHDCAKQLVDSASSNLSASEIFRHMVKYDSSNCNQVRKYPIKFHSDVTVEDYESEKVYMWLSHCFLKDINRNSDNKLTQFNRRDFDGYDAALNDVATEEDRQTIWWYYLLSMRSSAHCFNSPENLSSSSNRRQVEKRLHIQRGVWLKYFLSLVKHCLESSKYRYQYKAETMLGYYHDFSFHNNIAALALDCFSRQEFVTISTTLAELMPKNIPFLLRMAHHFFQIGDHVSLSSLLWRLIKTHNEKEGKCTNVEIWKIVISSAYANGNYKELMKLVRQAGKAVPRSKDVWRQMIVLVMKANNKTMLESMVKPMDCLLGESFGGLVSDLFATASKNK